MSHQIYTLYEILFYSLYLGVYQSQTKYKLNKQTYLFFNISTDYDVKVRETSQCVYAGERYFAVAIKKH